LLSGLVGQARNSTDITGTEYISEILILSEIS